MKNYLFGSNKNKANNQGTDKNRSSGMFGIVTSKIAGSNRNKAAHQSVQPTTTTGTS